MATAVVQVQTATATAGEVHGTAILSGAPKREGLSTWWSEVRRVRRGPRTRREAREPQPQALRPPPAARPRPSESTLDPRGTDSGVPSLVSATETISATTSEESRRAAPPVHAPAQTRQAAATGTGILDVEVRLTIQEKLRTVVLASSLGLKADRMADFTEQEDETLRQFQTAYDANRIVWFRGKRMPSVIFELVALRSDDAGSGSGGRLETSICVRGLHSEDDIKKFHEIMSRSTIRRLYSGMRLSYDKTLIQRPAKKVDEEYDHLPSSLGETLCGTRLVTRRPGHSEWSSTIGGIIQIHDELYAMTSSHTPDDDELDSGAASLADMSSPSTLVGSDYGDDVEPALILDLPRLEKSVSGGDNVGERGDPRETPSYFWPTLTARGPTWEHGDDCRLIWLSKNHCFPNSLPQLSEHSSGAKRTYITEVLDRRPSRRKVSILAGFSGLRGGILLSSPAFLSIHGSAPTEVWTVVLDGNTTLQKGDSGSWAVDDQGRWIGTVTAMSKGDAYLIPAHVQLQQLRSHFNAKVSLPSPLRCYSELAADSSFSNAVANSFATMALTPEVLIASASDMGPTALALATAKTSPMWQPEDEENLRLHLRVLGGHLLSEFQKRSVLPVPPGMAPHGTVDVVKEIYHSIVTDGRMGSRAEIQALFEGRKPASDGDSISPQPHGPSSDATTKPGLPIPEPSKEKPSETPNPFFMLPHDDEGKKHVMSHGRAFVHFIVNSVVLSGVSALAGMAALAAFLRVQPSLQQDLSASLISVTTTLGSTAGIGLAAPLVWEYAVRRLLSLFSRRLPFWTVGVTLPLIFTNFTAVIFARSVIAVLLVSQLLSINDPRLLVAAVAASAPLLIDTILSTRVFEDGSHDLRMEGLSTEPWMFPSRTSVGERLLSGIVQFATMYPVCVGGDALAGYTFARVANNYGVELQPGVGFNDGAAAAAGAVYGTVACLCGPLSLGVLLIIDYVFPTQRNGNKQTRAGKGRTPTSIWDLARRGTFEMDKGKAAEAPVPMPVPAFVAPPMSQLGPSAPWVSSSPPGEPVGSGNVLIYDPERGPMSLVPLQTRAPETVPPPVVEFHSAVPWSLSHPPGDDPVSSGGWGEEPVGSGGVLVYNLERGPVVLAPSQTRAPVTAPPPVVELHSAVSWSFSHPPGDDPVGGGGRSDLNRVYEVA